MRNNRGQLTLSDAPSVVLIVGLTFLVMATIALVADKYDTALASSSWSEAANNSVAQNVTEELQTEISNNTSIAGIVLTISLVGIVLTVLIGIFVGVRSRKI